MRYLEISCPSECPFNRKLLGAEYLTGCTKLKKVFICNDRAGFNKDCPLRSMNPKSSKHIVTGSPDWVEYSEVD